MPQKTTHPHQHCADSGVFTLVCGALFFVATLPDRVGDQETLLLGQTRFSPGSPAGLRVAVRRFADGDPVPKADIKVTLKPSDGGKTVTPL